ncbi:MAG TPA: hypothetical protein VGH44_03485 [Candidatus Saccharimonadia bacterium]|jgi:hypothetical protein
MIESESEVKHSPDGRIGNEYAQLTEADQKTMARNRQEVTERALSDPTHAENNQMLIDEGNRRRAALHEAREALRQIEAGEVQTDDLHVAWEAAMGRVDDAKQNLHEFANANPLRYESADGQPIQHAEQSESEDGRERVAQSVSAGMAELARESEVKGDSFMAKTYADEAARLQEAGGLAYDMAHDDDLARNTEVSGHLNKDDQHRATVEVMAKASLHHVQRHEKALARGDQEKAEKHLARARKAMSRAAYQSDFRIDSSNMVKKRWQFWK